MIKYLRPARSAFSAGFLRRALLFVIAAAIVRAEPITITPQRETLHEVSPWLFGSFLEMASWNGESGASLLMAADGTMRRDVIERFRELDPQLVRYPGGTFLSNGPDYEWQHLIDHAPGRDSAARPDHYQDHNGEMASTAFGWDEFFQLRDLVPFEPIVVVELEDAGLKREPLAEAVVHSGAALVAYLNGTLDQGLSPELEAYVQARIRNGHPEPHGVKFFQLGNEYFVSHHRALRDDDPTNDFDSPWFARSFVAYVDAMKAVDPSIIIIADGLNLEDEAPFLDLPGVAERVDFASHHTYWPMGPSTRHPPAPVEGDVDPDSFSPEEWWMRWVSGFGQIDDQGNTRVLRGAMFDSIERGFRIAHTEWNWNGWDSAGTQNGRNYHLAMGVGVGAYLNGLIRDGDHIAFANQSMTVGNGWNVPAIRVPDDAAPFFSPQAQAVKLFRHHARAWCVAHKTEGMRFAQVQHYNPPHEEHAVTIVDAVVTGDAQGLTLMITNRSFDEPIDLLVDLTGSLDVGGDYEVHQHSLVPRDPYATLDDHQALFVEWTERLAMDPDGSIAVRLAPQSMHAISIEQPRK